MKYQHIMVDLPECEMLSIQENVKDWRPGKRVHVTRDQLWLPLGCFAMLLVVPGIVVAIGYGLNSLGNALVLAGLIAVAELFLFVIPFFRGSGRKEIVFDWLERHLHYQFGRQIADFPLNKIDSIILETEQHSSDPIRTSAKMKLLIDGQHYEVFETYQRDVSALKSAAAIFRISERLAECLNVPLKLEGVVNDRSTKLPDVLALAKTPQEIAEKYSSLGNICSGYMSSCEFRGLTDEAEIHKAEAIDHYMRAHELDSSLTEPLLRLGNLSGNRKIQEQAVRDVIDSSGDGRARIELGYLHFRNHEYQEALQVFSEVIETNPSADAYNGRANVFESLENYQDAINDVTSAIELEPKEPANYSNRGRLTLELHDESPDKRFLNDVLTDYEKALQLEPESTAFQIARAEVWHKQGKVDEAIAEFDRIVIENSDDFYVYSQRGHLFLDDGRWPEMAVDDFTRVIELLESERPDDESSGTFLYLDSLAYAYEFRAEAYQRIGEFHKSVADQQRSEELFDLCE